MMDQTAVENLAMGNMHEMPVAESEKKIEAMEKELQVLKGSIKKTNDRYQGPDE